jgi:rubrerythrin
MQFLRCRICGDTYLGTEAPSRCPFCGAADTYFVAPRSFASSENIVQLTEIERENLRVAVEIERSNTRYYLAAAALLNDEDLSSGFKRLARVEAEHCGIFSRLLGEPKPDDLDEADGDPADWCEAITESTSRESHAAAFYAGALTESTNPRVREVFAAVSEVERDHLVLDEVAATLAGC